MYILEHVTKPPVQRMTPVQRNEFPNTSEIPEVIDPLVMWIKIHSNYVPKAFLPSQLRTESATEHVPGLVLREAIRLGVGPFLRMSGAGDNVNNWVDLDEARAGYCRPNSLHCFDRGSHQVSFKFKTSPRDEWKHGTLVPRGPRKKRNLINRAMNGGSSIWPPAISRRRRHIGPN